MSEVAAILREEIRRCGSVRFDRFMEVALYEPEVGYYERETQITGRSGDFYTSVSVGSLFGELLGFRFGRWLRGLGAGPVQLVEAGAHDGRLAADILRFLREWFPDVFARMAYWILEPSPRRRRWQRETLQEWEPRVQWFGEDAQVGKPAAQSVSPISKSASSGEGCTTPESRVGIMTPVSPSPALRAPSPSLAERDGVGGCPDSTAREPVRGVIFGNELLDAFPVRRLAWDAAAQGWFEWGVTIAQEGFAWTRLPVEPREADTLPQPPAPLRSVLPDGYTIEFSPAASAWWRNAAQALQAGWLVAFDYGLDDAERWRPERQNGTLRAYTRHHASHEVLETPGEQDLTAHVDFAAIQAVGEQAGLKSDRLVSQAGFFTGILAETLSEPASFPAWTANRRRQFQTLTHPEHLGRAFRVLVQRREQGRKCE